MKRIALFSLGAMLAVLASEPALPQTHGGLLPRGPSRLNPSLSLSAPAPTPLQAQMQDNYAALLRAQQRDLLQQDPSGLSRQEIAIGHELNGFTPH